MIGATAIHVHLRATEAQIGVGIGTCGASPISENTPYEVTVGAAGGTTLSSGCATASFSRSGDTSSR